LDGPQGRRPLRRTSGRQDNTKINIKTIDCGFGLDSFAPVEKLMGHSYEQGNETQNYWVFGHFPSPGIPENRKHDVSETGSIVVLM
jgi:hypothetical protein